MSLSEAAGLHVTYPTSYVALALRARLREGEWVLVHAAAGGVGLVAVQIAKALGARVIATAGGPTKMDAARRWGGADEVVDYNAAGEFPPLLPVHLASEVLVGWQKEVMRITDGKGAGVAATFCASHDVFM